MLKKECIFPYKQMLLFFILCGTSELGTLRPIFRAIDFLVHNKFIISIFRCIILFYNLEL